MKEADVPVHGGYGTGAENQQLLDDDEEAEEDTRGGGGGGGPSTSADPQGERQGKGQGKGRPPRLKGCSVALPLSQR